MQFIDRVKLKVKAGDGGNGMVSFRREKYVPLGGPSGGDGGKGGSVIFIVDEGKSTLLDLRYNRKINAANGVNGKTKKMHGACGEDTYVKVPLGTLVRDLATGNIIADLTRKGQKAIIVEGGKGGRGNFRFKSSRNTAPEYAEKGAPGEVKEIEVELKVLADVGLVGFPSVGKSTLLSVVSAAKPEIADYHFTTIQPNLGLVKVNDGRSFVMADLPGLIEGASQGKGMGHQFLKHIERCRVIIHVVDMGAY
ncbi:MAG: GTPase ObgE, partial [Erysipelotrichia bacterium]|nr:GTPase ObgE [Erysipelotrichia bacterium]